MQTERKVILYIATSVDGYIAKPGNDMSFLSVVEQQGQDYGYGDFVNTVDTVILGRKTYDWVMTQVSEFPHDDKETYIITHTPRLGTDKITFYTGNLKLLVSKLKSQQGKNIFVDGGAEVVCALLKEKLIDEFYISVIPIILGAGVRLFHELMPEQKLKLVASQQFNTGLVQLHYTL